VYPKYFGLKEPSFSIAPDPHYLFLSEQHREALAHLLYGAGESGGFVLLTGEVGTGKTTVCRAFLEQLPEGVDVALILNPAMTANELLLNICDEFRIPVPAGERSVKLLVDRLNTFLLAAHANGRRPVLLIDEAQNLRPKVMEQIRLLTNLETTKHKLLQIFLIGQPELRQMLASPDLRQLNQRITARFHLRPLGVRETAAYVDHRIAVAGVDRPLFTAAALREVHRRSGGVPRLINLLCDRALLGAAVSRQMQVTPAIVRRAAGEVRGSDDRPLPGRGRALATAASVLLAAGLGLWVGAAGVLDTLPARMSALIPKERAALLASEPSAGEQPSAEAADARADGAEVSEDASTASTREGPASAMDAARDGEATDSVPPGAPPDRVAAAQDAVADETGNAEAGARDTGEGSDGQPRQVTAEPGDAPAPASDNAAPDLAHAADRFTSDASVPAVADAGEVSTAVSGERAAAVPAADPQSTEARFPRIAMAAVAPDLPEVAPEELAKASIARAAVVDELLRLWGVAADAAVSRLDCPAVAAFGLDCERSNGRWSDLRQFDRPVALELTMADGSERFAVIGGIDTEYAMVHHDGQAKRVPIATLDERWSGDYLLLWRLPPVGVRVIGSRSSPEAVAWLRERMAALPDVELSAEPARYDAALTGVVRQFQSSTGLVADGVAGPRTLIMLRNALQADSVVRVSQSR
jgi:type II secretory pathway predicted ATPase ExeA